MTSRYNNILSATCLCLMATVGVPAASCQTAESAQIAPFSDTFSPEIPTSVQLCGQKVNLDPLDYAERYDRELTSVIYTHGNTLLMIKRANRYFPQIAPLIRQAGLPDDLVYLACVESTLNPRAVSPAKAAGLWQFMPTTAKEYGLEVNDEVDERFNIELATRAACRYFKKALGKYGGDWASVFASYNTGMARVTKQLDAQLADTALDLYLSEETQRYPFRIMAIKEVMEHPARYGFALTADQLYQPREVVVEEVSGPVESWAEWADAHGISYRDLREENPWIRAPKLTNKTGKTYHVRVPMKESLSRSTARRSVYNPNWISR